MGIEQQQQAPQTIGPKERLRRVEEAEKALGEVVTSMSRVGVGHPSFAQLFGSASTLRQEIDGMKAAIARDAEGDKRLYGTGSAWREFKKGLGIDSDPVSAPIEEDAPVTDAFELDPVAFERHQRRLADAEHRRKAEDAALPQAPGGDATLLSPGEWRQHLSAIGGLPITHGDTREAQERRAEHERAQGAEAQAQTLEQLKVIAAAVAPSPAGPRALDGFDKFIAAKRKLAEKAAAAAAAAPREPATTGLEANEPAPPRPGEGQ